MCNAYNLKTNLAEIGLATHNQLGLDLVFPPGVDATSSNTPVPQEVYPRRDGLILRHVDPGRPGLEPALAHWNLTPYFHKGPLKAWKASTNNCRSETMATAPAFREAFRRRRAIIPATSFTEWTGPAGHKTAHAISRADRGLLFLAGIWENYVGADGPMITYTMVMIAAEPGDDVAPFHNRQPIVLDAAKARLWLDLATDMAPILGAATPGTLIVDPPQPAAA
ncbi:MAG TPA: SOS response-associated peptidase family protein [Caulobacteraceae bacterium]|nr:SOS response-associated peptidase family protein [Caulobacteraceae bacterium]